MTEDYYTTLRVHRTASSEDIEKVYRELARQYHPDLNPDDPEAESNFEEVQAAFEVLSDPLQRELYNQLSISYKTTRVPIREPSEFCRVARPPQPPWKLDLCIQELVLAPATCLLVIGIIGTLLNTLMVFPLEPGKPTTEKLALSVFLLMPGCLQIAGAVNMLIMRNYGLAVCGCIITMIPCVGISFWGFPFAIWGLVILRKNTVRDAFRS